MLHASAAGWSTLLAGAVACLALACCGAVQGAILPVLLRVDEALSKSRGVALVFAANLLGSVIGARLIGFELVAQFGRSNAALAAGATAALGALIAVASRRQDSGASVESDAA